METYQVLYANTRQNKFKKNPEKFNKANFGLKGKILLGHIKSKQN